jgi:hypothetical protein
MGAPRPASAWLGRRRRRQTAPCAGSGEAAHENGRANEWPVDRPTLQRRACQIAGRHLTPDAWTDVLPNRPCRPVCPA